MTETKIETTALSLPDLVKYSVRALIRRFHLNRDWIIGLIGERGSGKSLGGANIAIRDFMMNGEPCWSNMDIKLQVDVEDESAARYGLPGGTVTYEAEHIEKQGFLALDSRYEGGCLFFDEFNLEYGESRRSSTNVNLMTDRAIQQLRKMQCGLIYTVLNEMYVDTRIRENTDVFIRCSDIAYKAGNLQERMQQGAVFEWMIYPISTKFAGQGGTYKETNQALGPYQVELKHLWDAIDTYQRQAVGATKYSENKTLMPIQIKEDPAVVADKSRWGWLDDAITRFFDRHATDGEFIEIASLDFANELDVPKELWGATAAQIRRRIKDIEVTGRGSGRYPTRYIIPNRILV